MGLRTGTNHVITYYMMTKKDQVNTFVTSQNLRIWSVKTDQEAEKLVDDVIEGDFSVESSWEAAFEQFKRYFKSYAAHIDEMQRDHDEMYT
jgi:hypothetical protein